MARLAAEPKIIRELDRRLSELQTTVFSTPPPDFAEFKHRQGQWVALTDLKVWVVEQIHEAEKDLDDEDE